MIRYLRDVRCSLLEPVNSYALELEFAPNPFFEDSVLRREYHYSAESGRRPHHLVGHAIAWKVRAPEPTRRHSAWRRGVQGWSQTCGGRVAVDPDGVRWQGGYIY